MSRHRRRGAPDPAREVPRRAVRPPVRRPGQGRRPGQLRHAGRPRRGARRPPAARWCCSRTTAATLPLDPTKSTAVIGPLGDDQHDMLGPWWGQGQDADAVSRLRRHQGPEPEHDVHRRAARSTNNEPPDDTPADECGSTPGSPRPWPRRSAADQVVLALGETPRDERRGRRRAATSTCPGQQQELIDAIKATGKPFVVVLFNGRPLTLGEGRRVLAGDPRGLVPGRRGRQRGRRRAVRQGQPRRQAAGRRSRAALGQVPIYYNHEPTGRPCDVTSKYNSRYRDLADVRPAVRVRLRAQLHDVLGRRTCA